MPASGTAETAGVRLPRSRSFLGAATRGPSLDCSEGDVLSSRRHDILSLHYTSAMAQALPAFVTHHEIETFLGGGPRAQRQRQRLQQAHRLPAPHWLPRVDRIRTGVYPMFAVAGLLDGVLQAPRALERIERLTAKVFASAAFQDLAAGLQQSVAEVVHAQRLPVWRFDTVVQRLADLAEPAVLEWGAVVSDAEDELAEWGVRFSSEFGRVDRRSADMYVIALTERKERFSSNRVAAPMHKGSAVAVEHVTVMGTGMDFVMPALETHATLTESPGLDWSAVTDGDWSETLLDTQRRAQAFSFDAAYWDSDRPREAVATSFSLAGAASGRRAAAELLAHRRRV